MNLVCRVYASGKLVEKGFDPWEACLNANDELADGYIAPPPAPPPKKLLITTADALKLKVGESLTAIVPGVMLPSIHERLLLELREARRKEPMRFRITRMTVGLQVKRTS
jgi:hypothetical protein